jgi:hypothetical protein
MGEEATDQSFKGEKNQIAGLDDAAKHFYSKLQSEKAEPIIRDDAGRFASGAVEEPEEQGVPAPPERAAEPVQVKEEVREDTTEDTTEPVEPGAVPAAEYDGDHLIAVQVQGETMEVPFQELINGYQRQSDYTRKTQQLAEERKSVTEDVEKSNTKYQEAINRVEELAVHLQNEIQANPPNREELQNLRATNPGEYAARMSDMQRKHQMLLLAQQEQESLVQSQREEEVPRQIQMLKDVNTDFANNFDATYESVGRWVIDPAGGGLSADAWNKVVDHRQVLIAYKAMKADEQATADKKRVPRVRKKVAKLPRVRTGSAPEPGEAKRDAYAKAKDKMLQSPNSLDSIAGAFLAREQAKGE